jgi:hypothetical protein
MLTVPLLLSPPWSSAQVSNGWRNSSKHLLARARRHLFLESPGVEKALKPLEEVFVAVVFSRAHLAISRLSTHRLLIFLAGLNKQGGVARARCAIAAL